MRARVVALHLAARRVWRSSSCGSSVRRRPRDRPGQRRRARLPSPQQRGGSRAAGSPEGPPCVGVDIQAAAAPAGEPARAAGSPAAPCGAAVALQGEIGEQWALASRHRGADRVSSVQHGRGERAGSPTPRARADPEVQRAMMAGSPTEPVLRHGCSAAAGSRSPNTRGVEARGEGPRHEFGVQFPADALRPDVPAPSVCCGVRCGRWWSRRGPPGGRGSPPRCAASASMTGCDSASGAVFPSGGRAWDLVVQRHPCGWAEGRTGISVERIPPLSRIGGAGRRERRTGRAVRPLQETPRSGTIGVL